MIETILTVLSNLLANELMINNILLIAFFIVFFYLFMKENKDESSPVRWTDLLVDTKTNKLSLTKLGQFWGIAISSWVVVSLSQTPAAYSIFPMIFPAYLAYLAGSWAFNSYIKNKNDKDELK